MIGLDTHVVIRYLVQDDKKQSTVATRFVEKILTMEAPGYINLFGFDSPQLTAFIVIPNEERDLA